MHYCIILMLCFCINAAAWANHQDPISEILAQPASPEERISLNIEQAQQALDKNNPNQAINFATDAWKLASQYDYQKGLIASNIQLAKIYLHIKQYENAIGYYTQAREVYKVQQDIDGIATMNFVISLTLFEQKKYSKAKEAVIEALFHFRKKDNWIEQGRCHVVLGKIEDAENNVKDAIQHYEKAEELFRNSGYNTQQEDYELNVLLGTAHRNLLDYKAATDFYFKALDFAKAMKDSEGAAVCIAHIGWTFYLQEAYAEALKFCGKGLEEAKTHNRPEIEEQNSKCLGAVYLDLKDYEKAIFYLQKALKSANCEGFEAEKEEIFKLLAHLYEVQGDFKTALDYQKKYQTLRDTIAAQNNARQWAEMTNLHSHSIEEKVTDLLHAKKETLAAQTSLKNFKIVMGIGMILLISLVLFLLYCIRQQKMAFHENLRLQQQEHQNNLKQTTEQLEEANIELQRFAYIASHDLKEPLRNIASFTTLLKRRLTNVLDKDSEEYFQFVMASTRQITALVSDIFEYSKLNENSLTFNYVDMSLPLQKATTQLQTLIKEKNAKVTSDDLPILYSNAGYLQLIFKNIIENGIKYNRSEQPLIHISAKETEEQIELAITDNGIGISKEYHQYIFEMFRRLQNRQQAQGSGLGLAICKKMVRQLNGEIALESEQGKGTTFFIRFPKGVALKKGKEETGANAATAKAKDLNFRQFQLAGVMQN